MYTIEQLRIWGQGSYLLQSSPDYPIFELATDSRNIAHPEQALFIALQTQVRDGHEFVKSAYEKGVRCFLVSRNVDIKTLPGANVLVVMDTLAALQAIAFAHRKSFQYPIIGITGSNGKTIVKEWLYQLLGPDFNIVRSPKSYNSQSGVPLSVWQMSADNNLGIFEAGISQAGEMEKLEKIMRPDIGIFTNIGEAHSEGFINRRQKINEKLVLFSHTNTLIYCRDHIEVNDCILAFRNNKGVSNSEMKLFTWSARGGGDVNITRIERKGASTVVEATYENRSLSIIIPFTDNAALENAMHCWCTCLLLKQSDSDIAARMQGLQPVSMRLELRHGANDCTLINDAYNSDITSLLVAIAYLEQQRQHQQHTVILSDMLQIGRSDAELYEEVAAMVAKKNITRFIGVGPALYRNQAVFARYPQISTLFFKDTAALLKIFYTISFSNEAILIKGARIFEFEKIARLLERQVHQTVLHIDLAALRNNLDVYRKMIPSGVKVMAMVKAFAYGSGSFEIATVLQRSGIDYLTVAYTDEGIGLRKAGITVPIMVMSPDTASFDRMISYNLEPEIFNFRSLHAFLDITGAMDVTDYPVHIKLDTGMHRLGFNRRDIEALCAVLRSEKRLRVASVFSHLASSDNPVDDGFTAQQGKLFESMSTAIIAALPYEVDRHLCNSVGILRHPNLHYNMVRLGLGLYGIDSTGKLQEKLKHIGTLKTTIAQIREIAEGEHIGYGHDTVAIAPMKIATISIGYADGYMRHLKNGPVYVLVHGEKAPVTGSICMDMCMVDISHIPNAAEGDEVVVFGRELPVIFLAQWAGTISYEVMAGISQRVKRVYINEE